MTVKSYKMGPGTLLLGTAPLDISAQITQCVVTPSESVTEGDLINVLSGEKLQDDDEVKISFKLGATLLQDLTAAGVVDWSWDHDGTTEEPFVFVPNDELERGISGTCFPVPIAIGGEVKKRPTSDIDWRVKGTPVFGVYDPVEDEVTEDV